MLDEKDNMSDKRILRSITNKESGDGHPDFIFWCPACGCGHGVWTTAKNDQSVWIMSGTEERPTFTPSLLITYGESHPADRPAVCHLNLTDGHLVYHGDSTHELAGKTVPMEPF